MTVACKSFCATGSATMAVSVLLLVGTVYLYQAIPEGFPADRR